MAIVHSTLELDELLVSEALLDDVEANPHLSVLSHPEPLDFDAQGQLSSFLVGASSRLQEAQDL